MTRVPPVRREVLVPASPETAFAVFVDEIGGWWPIGSHSVFQDGTVAFVDGRIVEYSADGQESVWGTVLDWDPPGRLSFTWHPGRPASDASRVTVTFAAAGEQTLVVLLHEGWEVYTDPLAARQEYDSGWPRVLAEFAAGVATPGESTWIVLRHTAAGTVGSVFADPRFPAHVAFLERMKAVGYLVAAGPLEGDGREGMTILRLPGDGREAVARRLAEGDASVTGGLFDVEVRPWRVVSTSVEAPELGSRPGTGRREGRN